MTLPLGKVDWTPPETDDEIDFRFVPGPKLAKALINVAGEQGARGRHLQAFIRHGTRSCYQPCPCCQDGSL
ncbi:hypothetical protein [Streptomyces sp. NPDC052036]|uniref:hypothetical protein n=1 Tax=Streptomyces sp. NPDC052036 TaxID=3155171 RepID=UPI0034257FA8